MIFLSENLDKRAELLPQIFGLDTATLADWMHEGLVAKMLTGASHAPHVAAGAFCRLFLIPHGILVDERLLSVRLGVDTSACMDSWNALLEKFSSFCYRGAASEFFPRWWARGLEDWWFKNVDKSGPLAGKTATERVGLLAQTTGILGLVALPVPVGEQDFRPWRLCRLALEASPQQFIPVDPAQSVRVTPQADFPPWVEPHSASAKLALRARDDQRLNRKDVERLRKKYGV
jgi:hypothetical protein